MSGPKSVAYRPSAEEVARRAEEDALRQATSLFRVLCGELQALRAVATETGAAFERTIDIPVLPELPVGSASKVEAQNAELARTLADTRLHVHAAQRRAEVERLADYLSTLAELEDASADFPAVTASTSLESGETVESLRARAEQYLGALTPGAQLSDHAAELATGLASAPPDLALLALRGLRAEISRINREARRRLALDDRLRDLDIRVGALDRPALLREVLFARGDPGGITDEQLAALECRVEDEEKAATAVQGRNAVRIAMERALIAEGYQVLAGFETAVPRDGVLVCKPGLDFHAWMVAVDDDSIRLDVVRTALETDSRITVARDLEVETRVCADLPAILGRVAEAGVVVDRVRQLAPGDSPVVVLPNAKLAPPATASAHAPEERSL